MLTKTPPYVKMFLQIGLKIKGQYMLNQEKEGGKHEQMKIVGFEHLHLH
jgi:hypothetical protein